MRELRMENEKLKEEVKTLDWKLNDTTAWKDHEKFLIDTAQTKIDTLIEANATLAARVSEWKEVAEEYTGHDDPWPSLMGEWICEQVDEWEADKEAVEADKEAVEEENEKLKSENKKLETQVSDWKFRAGGVIRFSPEKTSDEEEDQELLEWCYEALGELEADEPKTWRTKVSDFLEKIYEEREELKEEKAGLEIAFAIVKDENEVNKKNFHKLMDEKKETQQNTNKLNAMEKVIMDTQGWGDFIADLRPELIDLLREAGYPDEDLCEE